MNEIGIAFIKGVSCKTVDDCNDKMTLVGNVGGVEDTTKHHACTDTFHPVLVPIRNGKPLQSTIRSPSPSSITSSLEESNVEYPLPYISLPCHSNDIDVRSNSRTLGVTLGRAHLLYTMAAACTCLRPNSNQKKCPSSSSSSNSLHSRRSNVRLRATCQHCLQVDSWCSRFISKQACKLEYCCSNPTNNYEKQKNKDIEKTCLGGHEWILTCLGKNIPSLLRIDGEPISCSGTGTTSKPSSSTNKQNMEATNRIKKNVRLNSILTFACPSSIRKEQKQRQNQQDMIMETSNNETSNNETPVSITSTFPPLEFQLVNLYSFIEKANEKNLVSPTARDLCDSNIKSHDNSCHDGLLDPDIQVRQFLSREVSLTEDKKVVTPREVSPRSSPSPHLYTTSRTIHKTQSLNIANTDNHSTTTDTCLKQSASSSSEKNHKKIFFLPRGITMSKQRIAILKAVLEKKNTGNIQIIPSWTYNQSQSIPDYIVVDATLSANLVCTALGFPSIETMAESIQKVSGVILLIITELYTHISLHIRFDDRISQLFCVALS